MGKTILITGGAGFIGSHVADRLLAAGHHVRALDRLDPQVHGDGGRPDYLDPAVEIVRGEIEDPAAVRRALIGVDAVYHLAARVGVGQSMWEIAKYTATNNLGTAVLLEALAERKVERLVVASSMSVYGEGLYRDADGAAVVDAARDEAQLRAGEWEPRDARGRELEPLPTPEHKPPALASVYALSKFDQERMCLLVGAAYGIPTVALRFFNAYGPRQALSNPYTGVLAIFASRLLNGRRPLIFEDGLQRRDFVSVHDVAAACERALDAPGAIGRVLNIGSGQVWTVAGVAERMARILGRPDLAPEISGTYRVGDIRHCFPDIAAARTHIGFEPAVRLEDGLVELAGWLDGRVAIDRVDAMRDELASRGLAV
ncbi:MAG TPA: NAD-dependent epimerase/dehydratase family protein [Planctomycetota bacterium]|nr:NAD-dependent epimerase/dehydratase family protein [Planctomycetota bacterium]